MAPMREFQALTGALCARRLMRNERNKLCLAPYSSRVGDSVCFIHSAEVPCVLRRIEGNHYRLVGEAYIQGLMHREFCKIAEDHGLEIHDIVLVWFTVAGTSQRSTTRRREAKETSSG